MAPVPPTKKQETGGVVVVPGKRVYSEGLKPGDRQGVLSWLVATITLTIYCEQA